jgi:hypothetical protein
MELLRLMKEEEWEEALTIANRLARRNTRYIVSKLFHISRMCNLLTFDSCYQYAITKSPFIMF